MRHVFYTPPHISSEIACGVIYERDHWRTSIYTPKIPVAISYFLDDIDNSLMKTGFVVRDGSGASAFSMKFGSSLTFDIWSDKLFRIGLNMLSNDDAKIEANLENTFYHLKYDVPAFTKLSIFRSVPWGTEATQYYTVRVIE